MFGLDSDRSARVLGVTARIKKHIGVTAITCPGNDPVERFEPLQIIEPQFCLRLFAPAIRPWPRRVGILGKLASSVETLRFSPLVSRGERCRSHNHHKGCAKSCASLNVEPRERLRYLCGECQS